MNSIPAPSGNRLVRLLGTALILAMPVMFIPGAKSGPASPLARESGGEPGVGSVEALEGPDYQQLSPRDVPFEELRYARFLRDSQQILEAGDFFQRAAEHAYGFLDFGLMAEARRDHAHMLAGQVDATDFEQAIALAEQALKYDRQIGSREGELRDCIVLADIYWRRNAEGDGARAYEWGRQARELVEVLPVGRPDRVLSPAIIEAAALRQRDRGDAIGALNRLLSIAQWPEIKLELGWEADLYARIGRAHLDMEDWENAARSLGRSLQLWSQLAGELNSRGESATWYGTPLEWRQARARVMIVLADVMNLDRQLAALRPGRPNAIEQKKLQGWKAQLETLRSIIQSYPIDLWYLDYAHAHIDRLLGSSSSDVQLALASLERDEEKYGSQQEFRFLAAASIADLNPQEFDSSAAARALAQFPEYGPGVPLLKHRCEVLARRTGREARTRCQ